jgi:hypothetical protein
VLYTQPKQNSNSLLIYNHCAGSICVLHEQVVKHRGTGVEYAMKTLRLNRLDDFQKLDELRNEIDVMSSLK